MLKDEDRQFGESLRAPPYRPSNQKVIYVPMFFDNLGLEEEIRPRAGRRDVSEAAGRKATMVCAEENANMETEEIGGSLIRN